MVSSASKTLKEVLDAGTDYLARKGTDQPRLACELLAARLLKCRRLELYLRYDTLLGDRLLDAMRRGVQRVGRGEPVQYVMGETDFMGHTFKVDSRGLIPRPETEMLVERVLACDAAWQTDRSAVADVGTGSGCIIISLAIARPKALYVGLDISAEALDLARENAASLKVADRIAFAEGELSDVFGPAELDIVVSNPPYVSTSEYQALPAHIREHEPRIALDGGVSGLSVVENLIQDASIALKPGGFIFMEIGETHAIHVASLLKSCGFDGVEVVKDLAGRDRIASAVLS